MTKINARDMLAIGILSLLMIACGVAGYMYGNSRSDNLSDQLRLLNEFMSDKPRNGFYIDGVGFCTLTGNRDRNDVAETTYHELAHYYDHQDPEHFNVELIR